MSSLLIYLPSLVMRYSVQMVTIGLPWIMQLRNHDLSSIAVNTGIFFTGSVVGGVAFYFSSSKIRIHWFLRYTLLAQCFLFAACFLIENDAWLLIVRFLQGISFGVFRPTNQIWINEFEDTKDGLMLAKRAAYSKVVISSGLFLGSIVGALAKNFAETATSATIFSLTACVIPTLLLFWVLKRNSPKKAEELARLSAKQELHNAGTHTERLSTWLWLHPESRTSVVIFFVGMAVHSLWLGALPFYFRAEKIGLGPFSSDQFVSGLLVLIPLLFSVMQVIVNMQSKKEHQRPTRNTWALFWILVAQTLLVTAAMLFMRDPLVCFILLILGGSIVPAYTFPIFMLVLYGQIQDSQGFLMRRMIVLLNLVSDLGQMAGQFILAIGLFGLLPEWRILLLFLISMLAMLWFLLDKESLHRKTALKQG